MSSKAHTERTIDRVLAVLRKKRLTAKELAEVMHMTYDTSLEYIRIMRARKLIYVVGHNPVERNKPVRVYTAGNRPDAISIPKKKPPKPSRRAAWKSKVLTALALPSSSKQIAERLGISYDYARQHVCELKKEGKIHITAWVLPLNTGSKIAVYKAGYGQDRKFVPRRGVYTMNKPEMTPPPAHSIFAALFAQPSTALPQ